MPSGTEMSAAESTSSTESSNTMNSAGSDTGALVNPGTADQNMAVGLREEVKDNYPDGVVPAILGVICCLLMGMILLMLLLATASATVEYGAARDTRAFSYTYVTPAYIKRTTETNGTTGSGGSPDSVGRAVPGTIGPIGRTTIVRSLGNGSATKGGKTRKPGKTGQSGITGEPGRTIKSTNTSKTGITSKPVSSLKPGKSISPGITRKPRKSSTYGTSFTPEKITRPGEGTEPGIASKTRITSRFWNTSKSGSSEKPGKSSKARVTSNPRKTSKPSINFNPEEITRPGETNIFKITSKPVIPSKPGKTTTPVNFRMPGGSTNPSVSMKHGKTTTPGIIFEADKINRPGKTTTPGISFEADKINRPEETSDPDTTRSHDSNIKPGKTIGTDEPSPALPSSRPTAASTSSRRSRPRRTGTTTASATTSLLVSRSPTTLSTRSTSKLTTKRTSMSTTPTRPTTTPTTFEGETAGNFTLICVFEYLRSHMWGKPEQCTDYVWIRFFTYTWSNTEPLVFQKKSKSMIVPRYYDQSLATWALFDNELPEKVRKAMELFSHARWFVGMWGSTYVRVMVTEFPVDVAGEALRKALRQDFGASLSIKNFTGFAIINTPIRGSRLKYASADFKHIFRHHRFGDPVLEPGWTFMHTASIYLPGMTEADDELVKNVYGSADIVGISTHNSSDEPNALLNSCAEYCINKAASPPNPIHPVAKGVRGMLDIVKEIPHWKHVLGKPRVCMSVTSAINYAESNVVNIDFKGEIGGLPDRVQRYTRHRFMTGFRFKPDGPKTKDFPVDHYRTEYHWDNATRTHFWRYFDQSNHLLVFFAYDQADSLRPKVKELLNAYPHDKCLVFDDLGDDSYASTIHTRTKVIKFQRFELLKAVAAEMTARYGRAFPAKYY